MYIINVTFVVEPPVHSSWYALATEKFLSRLEAESGRPVTFTRLLHDTPEAHYTYSVQCHCCDMTFYRRFVDELMADYVEVAGPMFGDKVLYFISLLKRIDYK